MNRNYNVRTTSPLGAIVVLALFGILAYFLVKGMYIFLGWITPVLIIATLFLDASVYKKYFQWLVRQFKTNVGVAIIATIFSFLGFPFLVGGLFVRALINNRLKSNYGMNTPKEQESSSGEYLDYEEIIEPEPMDRRHEI